MRLAIVQALVLVALGCAERPPRSRLPTGPSPSADPPRHPAACTSTEGVAAGVASPTVPAGPPPRPPADAVGDVTAVAVGSMFSAHAGCILLRSGEVHCWGGPGLPAQFDRGRKQALAGPWRVPALEDAIQIVAGGHRHCALKRDGTIWCWRGEHAPARQKVEQVKQLSAGVDHLCALLADGTVHCAGDNGSGQLGRSPHAFRDHPWGPVPGIAGAVQVASGGRGSCALLRDGRIACWGQHPFRLPHTDRAGWLKASMPSVVPGLSGIRAVALGGLGCVLDKKGVRCTGQRDGSEPCRLTRLQPARLLSGATSLAVADDYACVTTKNGDVWCWGAGPDPADPNAGADHPARPSSGQARRIADIQQASSVSVGSTHACAVTRAGHVRCWGDNRYGQLGDGTLRDFSPPVFVVSFFPEMLAGPGDGLFGCKPSPKVQRECPKLGRRCQLEPPPGSWQWGTNRGPRCTAECMQRAMERLKKRPVPPCMCTCSEQYLQRDAAYRARRARQQPAP